MISLRTPFNQYGTVSPDDTANIPLHRDVMPIALYVGTAGDVQAVSWTGNTIIFKNVPAGTILPITYRRINAAGTTATDLVSLFCI